MTSLHRRGFLGCSAILLLAAWLTGLAAAQEAATGRIRMVASSKVVEATMQNNATTRDFVRQLPLTLSMQQYSDGAFRPPVGLSSCSSTGKVRRTSPT